MLKTFSFVGNNQVAVPLTKSLVQAGFEALEEPAKADVVFIFCDSQTDLEDTIFDSNGLVETVQKGTYLVNLGASTPGFSREVNAVCLVSDLHAVEAPLVVDDITMEQAYSDPENLWCFLAGDKCDCEKIAPFLASIIETSVFTGLAGTAQAARAALTLQIASQVVSCMESDAVFKAFSLEGELTMRCAMERNLISERAFHLYEAVKAKRFSGTYSLQICMTELSATLMAADDVDLILPGAEASMHLLELLAVIGGAHMAPAALSLVYGDEGACAQYGLDWTRAEEVFEEDTLDEFGDQEFGASFEEYPDGFSGYSKN